LQDGPGEFPGQVIAQSFNAGREAVEGSGGHLPGMIPNEIG
jgi:hypothetical protein